MHPLVLTKFGWLDAHNFLNLLSEGTVPILQRHDTLQKHLVQTCMPVQGAIVS